MDIIKILNILVVLTGIWFLRKVLLKFFSNRITVITLILVVFGTNYFELITGASPFPQDLLFTLFSVILWLTIRWHEKPTWSLSLSLGLALGITILVNPSDWPVLLIPILWNIHDSKSLKEKGNFIRSNILKTVACFDPIIAMFVLLFVFWKPLSSFFGYIGFSQGGLFHMTGIYFAQVLFSLKNGWFIYTPLMIFAIAGFYFLAARNRKVYFSIFLYFLVNLIFLCSWSTYAMNDEFGRKMFMQSMAVLSLPLGYLMQALSEKKSYISLPFYFVLIILIFLNLFQTWQYRKSLLDPTVMTGNYYRAIFGRTHINENDLLQLKGFEPNPDLFLKDELGFKRKTLAFYNFEDTGASYGFALEDKFVKDGKWALRMDTGMRFSPGIRIRYGDLTHFSRVGIRMSAWFYSKDTLSRVPASLVVTSLHENANYHYRTLSLEDNPLLPGSWNLRIINYITPEFPVPDDELQAYIWYYGNSEVLIDDLKIELFEPGQ